MNVQAILDHKQSGIVTIEQDSPLQQAAHLMSSSRIGALVVMAGDKVAGMLTNREIVDALSSHGWRTSELRVIDVMRPDFATVTAADGIKHVMALMTGRRATHMPVFDDGRLIGIISIGDVLKHRLEDLQLETDVLRDAYIAVH